MRSSSNKKAAITIIISVGVILILTLNAQPVKWKNSKYMTIVSYNVENLFDTIDNPRKNDNEFTPFSKKKYNTKRYNKKISAIATVLSSINKKDLPEIIGLAEVENKAVLNNLIETPQLQKAHYKVILEEGPDPRGIDCALLYRPDVFKYLSHKAVPVKFPFAGNRRTRDILYVKGVVKKDTLHIFVNHWSSRRGGMQKSEPKRVQSAKVLKHNVDSLLALNPDALIFIMGDFNDEPVNKSIYNVLDAGGISEHKELVNLVYSLDKQGKGTYYYRGKYNMLDNMIVSQALINNKKGVRIFEKQAYIFHPDFICYTHKNGDKSPAKTYGGKNYYGGFSDHFPVYTILYQK